MLKSWLLNEFTSSIPFRIPSLERSEAQRESRSAEFFVKGTAGLKYKQEQTSSKYPKARKELPLCPRKP
jgi:hypothetical protein